MPTTTAWAGWVGRLTVVLPALGLALCRGRSILSSGLLLCLTCTVWAGVEVLAVVLEVCAAS